jgi:AraC family transcriptional regulator, positive regulator of tynA and feaB
MGRALAALIGSIGSVPGGFDALDRALMADTIVSFLRRSLESSVAVTSRDNELLARLSMWMRENITDPRVTPEVLAAEFRISRRRLYRLFEALATTPAAWIWETRLAAAHDRLAGGTASVTDVAFAVGFKDLGHFSRAFRRRFGYSPREVKSVPKIRLGKADASVPSPVANALDKVPNQTQLKSRVPEF